MLISTVEQSWILLKDTRKVQTEEKSPRLERNTSILINGLLIRDRAIKLAVREILRALY